MLKTFVAPFDYHAPKGGRRLFAEFASTLSERFDTNPQIIDDPVFSYARCGRSRLERLRELDESLPAIVYLSNVVMHSALLIVGDCDVPDLAASLTYDSVKSFIDTPYVEGFGVGADTQLQTAFDDTTILISDLARFRNDENALPDDGLFRIIHQMSDIFVCNVLNWDRYFAHVSVNGDQPFFLLAESDIDIDACIRQYAQETLREFLLEQSLPFATLADDHMDDEFAVSYGMDCWRFSDDNLAFAR